MIKVVTAVGKHRKRKHRWSSVRGKTVTVRFSDSEFEEVIRQSATKNLSPGLYLKWLAISQIDISFLDKDYSK